jgi:hypothetical protein
VKWLPMMVSACLIIVACFVAYPFFMTGGDYLPRDGENNSNPNGDLSENPAPGENGEPFDPLMPYDEQALLEAWAEYFHVTYRTHYSALVSADNFEIWKHHGFWGEGNYDVVSIRFKEWDEGMPTAYDFVGYTFYFEIGGAEFMYVYTGETFLSLVNAHKQGLLSLDDIEALWKINKAEFVHPDQKLKEAYAAYRNELMSEELYFADDIGLEYYGVWGGYDVAAFWIGEKPPLSSVITVIGGYNFGRINSNIMVYFGDANFVHLGVAHSVGWLSTDDVGALCRDFFRCTESPRAEPVDDALKEKLSPQLIKALEVADEDDLIHITIGFDYDPDFDKLVLDETGWEYPWHKANPTIEELDRFQGARLEMINRLHTELHDTFIATYVPEGREIRRKGGYSASLSLEATRAEALLYAGLDEIVYIFGGS